MNKLELVYQEIHDIRIELDKEIKTLEGIIHTLDRLEGDKIEKTTNDIDKTACNIESLSNRLDEELSNIDNYEPDINFDNIDIDELIYHLQFSNNVMLEELLTSLRLCKLT